VGYLLGAFFIYLGIMGIFLGIKLGGILKNKK